MEYELYEILLCFSIYSILGWITEVCLFALQGKNFQNRGICKGPYLISFGFGALAIIYAEQFISASLPLNSAAFLWTVFGAGVFAGLIAGFGSKVIINGLSKEKTVILRWYHPILAGLGAVILACHVQPLIIALLGRIHPFIHLVFLLIYWTTLMSQLVDSITALGKRRTGAHFLEEA